MNHVCSGLSAITYTGDLMVLFTLVTLGPLSIGSFDVYITHCVSLYQLH